VWGVSKKLDEVHSRATKRMDTVWGQQKDERALCLEDRRFYSVQGAQWDDEWGVQFENAPRLEIDKTHKEVVRIFSDYRNNRISVDFRPSDEAADDDTADTLDGLYRADMAKCNGQEADDTAFEEGVGGGMGGARLRAVSEDEADPDNEYQRIVKEPVPDADQRMFFDPDSIFQDKHDAKWALLLTPMSEEAFESEYGEKASTDFKDWPREVNGFEWHRAEKKVVWVGEYYEVEQNKTVCVYMVHPVIDDGEETKLHDPSDETLADMAAEGWSEVRRRDIKRPRVHKYCLSGKEVLKDEGLIAGRHIPLIPFYGKRWYVEGIERCSGHVRKAKDPQKLYNAEVSQLADISGSTPREVPIFDPEQINAKMAQEWADMNIKRLPFVLAKALRNEDGTIAHMGPIGTVAPPQMPKALAALLQISNQDIAEIIGANEQAEEVPSNTSAQAIELVHTRSDDKNFIYLDNFRQYKTREGEVWLSMAEELYVEEGRRMQALDETGGRKYVALGESALAKDGDQVTLNDFSRAKFDVIVDVGPSSQSRRDSTVRSLVGIAQVAAQVQLMDLAGGAITAAISQMDGEGIDGLKDFARKKGIMMGTIKPTEEEAAELAKQQQNQPQDPNAMLAQGMTQQALAEAEKAKAGTVKTLAEVEKIKVQIAETLAGIKREDRQQWMDAVMRDADRLAEHAVQMNGAT